MVHFLDKPDPIKYTDELKVEFMLRNKFYCSPGAVHSDNKCAAGDIVTPSQ